MKQLNPSPNLGFSKAKWRRVSVTNPSIIFHPREAFYLSHCQRSTVMN